MPCRQTRFGEKFRKAKSLAIKNWERRVYSAGFTILAALTILRVIIVEIRDLFR